MKKEVYRILHVVPNMNSGGIENLIMNIYRKIDRTKIQFDFIVHYEKKGFFDDEIESLGGKIYRFPVIENKNVIKYIKDLNQFFKTHKEYKVVHGHMASLAYLYLGIAKKYRVPVRIAHSHGTSHLKNLKGYCKYIMFKFAKYNANNYYACSTEAGNYLFGKNRKFEFIPNAIELEKFAYSEKTREEVRKKLKINDKIVIGHVGRFNLQKNHEFIIDIFKAISEKNKKCVLLLIGIGELQEKIKQKICDYKLEDKIYMLGLRKDVAELYQAMDIFLMPSLFEGLPLTGVEAQASKLKCIFSDTITREVKITDNIEFLNLSIGAEKWAEIVLNNINYDRKKVKINNTIFDIKTLAKQMQQKYIDFYKE